MTDQGSVPWKWSPERPVPTSSTTTVSEIGGEKPSTTKTRVETASEHADREFVFKYWVECERIAIHFNDLVIRFRLQALGGLAVVSGVLGFARAKDSVDWSALTIGLLGLVLFWWAAAAVDVIYYGRLLRGAVAELKRVESGTDHWMQLSTKIEEACKDDGPRKRSPGFCGTVVGGLSAIWWAVRTLCGCMPHRARSGRFWFYVLPTLALGIAAFVSWSKR